MLLAPLEQVYTERCTLTKIHEKTLNKKKLALLFYVMLTVIFIFQVRVLFVHLDMDGVFVLIIQLPSKVF